MSEMDPSICRLHPGVAVTGFCPACLRDRLAGLQPPSAADLRRCKSFSYARSAAAVEPQRRSCDLFRQPIVAAAAVPEEDYRRPQEQEARKSSSFLGRKLQQWRRKNKQTCNNKEPAPEEMSGRHRPSCDAGPPSWSGPVLPRQLPATMLSSSLSVEEDDDMPVPRSDGQIPVEEDYYYGYGYDNGVVAAVPGGSVQTRDYYLDSSSSSSRRRRSVDRATSGSGRNSFSDANNGGGGELPTSCTNGGNAKRVSPAVVGAAERLYQHHYHEAHQSVLVHHHQYLRRDDAPQIPASRPPSSTKTTKGIRGRSIWGLINKKSSSRKQRQPEASFFSSSSAAAAGGGAEYPWPELRARGYDGQMLRCNSSVSARSSFSGGSGAAMIGRRSISGVDFRDHGVPPPEYRRTTRRDEVLLERTRSSSSSYSTRSVGNHNGGIDSNNPAMGISSRPPSIPRRRPSSKLQHEQRRSTLGL